MFHVHIMRILLRLALNIDLFEKQINDEMINIFAKKLSRSLHLLENAYDDMLNDMQFQSWY